MQAQYGGRQALPSLNSKKKLWVKITVTQELELGLVNLYLALNPLLHYMGQKKNPPTAGSKLSLGQSLL
jgi:hypothetical protein